MKEYLGAYGRDEKGPSFRRDGLAKCSIFNFFFSLTEDYTSDLTFQL